MEINNPIIARGMLNQFNHPRNGIIPKNIPHIARIPNILPKVFIIYYFQELVDKWILFKVIRMHSNAIYC